MTATRTLNVSMLVVATAAVITGLYWFADILTPLALAVFLWLVIDGFADWIGRRAPRTPKAVALTTALVIVFAAMAFIAAFVAENAAEFAKRAGGYHARLDQVIAEAHAALGLQGAPPTVGELFARANPSRFLGEVASALQGVTSQGLFVVIYVICLFAAQSSFPGKLDAIFPEPEARARARVIAGEIRASMEQYLWVQTVTGLMIAAASFAIFLVVGLDNALFWALVTFLLSYVPVIGGALASLLPALFALVQFPSLIPAGTVLIGSQIVQFVVGNVILPRMTGDSLNISVLVVFLSLAAWGAIWGIPGMFLAVPLTVMAMIVLAQFASTRWLAVLISSNGAPSGTAAKMLPQPVAHARAADSVPQGKPKRSAPAATTSSGRVPRQGGGRSMSADKYLADVKTYAPNANEAAVAGIVKYLGIALRSRDSSLVAGSDPAELARVREKFLKKKLELSASDAELDKAIAAVIGKMKGDATKERVTVYYLLADHFGKLGLFVK